MEVQIVNHRATTVWIGASCLEQLTVDGHTDGFLFVGTCDDVILKHTGSVGDCMSYSWVPILPGATYTTGWSGLDRRVVTLPDECYPPNLHIGCVQSSAVAPGPKTLTVELYATAGFEQPFQVSQQFVFGTDSTVKVDVQ